MQRSTLPPHPLLSLLPPTTIEHLLADGAVGEYQKGSAVFRAGGPCDAIFLILSGRCEGCRADGEVENVFGPGDLLGARALLNGEPHKASAIVVTHAVLLRIPAKDLTGLFASDPCAAGRFSQTVTAINGHSHDHSPRVRRIVALLPLAQRVDSVAVVRHLAGSLHSHAQQRALIIHIGDDAERAAPLRPPTPGPEFSFTQNLRRTDAFDELQLAARSESRDAIAVAPFLSHCGRHYDFVLLHPAPETPQNVLLEMLTQSDLGFVLLDSSARNVCDFDLLIRALCDRNPGACAHVKPILFADSAATPDIARPVHSIMRGFPRRDDPSARDRRYDLAINRLAREIARRRVGLALSSGSAKGLAHIGVIQVLEENGIEIDCVAGASMGAYVGAVWTSGLDGVQLERVARETEGRWGFLKLLDPALPPRRGFLHTRRIAARLRRAIGDAHFTDLDVPLRVVATHLDTLERAVFSSGSVADAVEASIAIPGVCVPVTLGGTTYIDGSIADPLPVDVLAEMGIERIIAVNVIPPPEHIRYWLDARRELNGREQRPTRYRRFVNSRLNYGASGNIIDTMMRAINGAQTRVAEASAREADLVLRPLGGGVLWHDFSDPKKHIALGRSIAAARIGEIKDLIRGTPHEPQPALAFAPRIAA